MELGEVLVEAVELEAQDKMEADLRDKVDMVVLEFKYLQPSGIHNQQLL
jgi:hypothetical protein